MRRTRGGAVLALVAVVALGGCGGGEPDRRVAALDDPTPETTETTEAPTTTTSAVAVPAPVVTAPPVTTTSINLPKVKLPITTTTAKPVAAKVPPEPDAEPWGTAGLGVHRVITQGPTRLDFGLYERETYENEFVEVVAETHDPGVVRYAHVDWGDGQQWTATFYYSCDPQSHPNPKPNPIFYQTGRRQFAQPGAYKVTLTLKTVRCTEWGPNGQEIEPNTIVSSFTAYRHGGARPR